jgi:hypothetical protein
MKELTFEEFCKLPLNYWMGFQFDWGAHRVHRNDKVGLQVETFAHRKRKGDIYSGWKKEKKFFFLDNDARQFDTIDQVYVAYMEKVCGIGAKK